MSTPHYDFRTVSTTPSTAAKPKPPAPPARGRPPQRRGTRSPYGGVLLALVGVILGATSLLPAGALIAGALGLVVSLAGLSRARKEHAPLGVLPWVAIALSVAAVGLGASGVGDDGREKIRTVPGQPTDADVPGNAGD